MELDKYENIDYAYMKDYVYEVLKKNIIELRLKPGMNLKKEKIAKELGVSITPIREAFARLSEDELVDIYPQKGTYVSLINMKKVEQAKFMREHLERAVIRLACNEFTEDYILKLKTNIKMQEIFVEEEDYFKSFELDNEFHKIIFQGCNKKDIWLSIQQISSHVSRLRVLSLAADFNGNELIIEHQEILDAIQQGDKELADRIIAKHISRIKFDSDKLIREYPGYFEKQ